MVSTFKAVNAQGYQQIMGRFSARLATSFLSYIGQESGQAILDLGCGTGSMTFTLAERGDHKSIVGIDLSEAYPHSRLRSTLSTERFPSWFSSSCRIRFRLSRKCTAWSNLVD